MLEKYSAKNPANRVRLTLREAWGSPLAACATFFGAGVMRPAPGTWGTLVGVLVFAALSPVVPLWGWIALSAALFVAGALGADRLAAELGVEDHGGIVADEVVAVWLVCAFLPAGWAWLAAAFLAFRLFDILKIWPGSWVDRTVKNGWGVMADDLIAALYAWAAVRLGAGLLGVWPEGFLF